MPLPALKPMQTVCPVDDVIIENIEFKTFGELYNG